ncbi:cytochrome P450 [Rhodococcus sp. IEGM 1307]|uniref:cytochrome P450 n=1 Tax=Rhodococcus sp. IEGM 1307 TaxID=3047091 RepID=UPI0024B67E42|nr:cytochrome P450 [Rhodococcus sp. IEGM 1307]MDI9979517.1 cytochrome P450 [Rhodococcus sp. IEGM 1307]
MTLTNDRSSDLVIPDLSDPATFTDAVPNAAFAEIRNRPGLHWVATPVANSHGGYWAVTRYDEIVEIERDPASFTATNGSPFPYTNLPKDHPAKDNVMCVDPPRHNYLRRATAKGFAPRIVANFEPWVRDVVIEIIEGLEGKTEFDFIEEYGRTIPAFVIARVLGAPKEDRAYLVQLIQDYIDAGQMTESLEEGEGVGERIIPLMMQITDYAAKIQKVKLANPADDMFTELARCVERGEINQDEYLQWMFVMLAAGYETTQTTIGQSMRMYLEDPEIREATDKAIAQGETMLAVEEYLRLISPPMQMARTATRDLDFHGQKILEGQVMVLYYVAANRDTTKFSEPDRFNPWRPEKENLVFGAGAHRCIGSHLAKLELQILWDELAKRNIRYELAGEPKRGYSNFINQLRSLPVRRP